MQPNPPGLDLLEKNNVANTKKPTTGVTWWHFLSKAFYDTVGALLFAVCLPNHVAS